MGNASKILVVVLIFLLLPVISFASKKIKWETVQVYRVIDNEHFALYDGRVIQVIGLDAPDIFKPNRADQCFARKTYRLLKIILEDGEIKILRDETRRTRDRKFLRHVKIEDGKNLAEFMLENGMARFRSAPPDIKYDKKYRKAEEFARLKKAGIWGDCGAKKSRTYIRRKAGRRSLAFRKKYTPYFANISVGHVKRVLSGDRFELENGLRIKLLGVKTPGPDDPRVGFSCFGEHSKRHLEELVLGQKVFLERDASQFNEDYEMLRYAFVGVGKMDHQKTFVNKQMIADGYAHNVWDAKDSYFRRELGAAQKEIYENPRGAWVACIRDILGGGTKRKQATEYDPECRIKGNISGSKSNPTKTYHTPKSGWYRRIQPEQCFETEEAAEFAGFRKVK